MRSYADTLKTLLSPREHRVFEKLSSPQKIQDYLDRLPINFEEEGDTIFSPRQVLRQRKAHCIEGALFAAASLAYHGHRPLLMDLQTLPHDDDHVVALFKVNGLWGAISKTNHAILRWRDPVYRTVRELAMSFFHEYYLADGEKTFRAFSQPFDLRRYHPQAWVTAEMYLEDLAEELDASPHFPIAPKAAMSNLRKASRLERRTIQMTEWD